MANVIYPSFLQQLMEQYFKVDAPWTAAEMDIFVCGVGSGYTFSESHHAVEDLGINVVLPPAPVPEVDLVGGLMKAGDVETQVGDEEAGDTVVALVLFCANDDGSQLIAFIDEGQPMQLPTTLLSGKFFVRWNPQGILRI